MSGATTTAPTPTVAPTPAEAATASVRNDLVAASKDLPDLIAKAQVADPALAAQLTAKPLIASKTPIGTLVAGVVAWAAGRYGLGWDQTTCDLVAGCAVLLGGYGMRYISSSPIAGIFSKGATP